MKKLLLLAIFATTSLSFAQEIKIIKVSEKIFTDKVTVSQDGRHKMKFDSKTMALQHFLDMGFKIKSYSTVHDPFLPEEIILIKYAPKPPRTSFADHAKMIVPLIGAELRAVQKEALMEAKKMQMEAMKMMQDKKMMHKKSMMDMDKKKMDKKKANQIAWQKAKAKIIAQTRAECNN